MARAALERGMTAAQTIRATGRRLTIQRSRILDALRGLPGHSTAAQIRALVNDRERDPDMAMSTVYRNLEALVDMGLVVAFTRPGDVMTYEWGGRDTPHHHLLCDGCGHTKEVEVSALGALASEVQRKHGFAVDLRHIAIRGQCANCQHESEARP